jgi:AraC-like DNA-binding protein
MFSINIKTAYWKLTFLFVLISTIGNASPFLDSVKNCDKSTAVLDLYESKDESYEITDSLFAEHSAILANEINDTYVIHQLAWCLYKKRNSQKSEAIIVLEDLKKHLAQSSISGSNVASYYTLYGILLYELHESEKARTKFLKGLDYSVLNQDTIGEKGNLINVGNTYFIQDNLDSALFWFQKAEKHSNINEFEANRKNNIATIYMNMDKYPEAISMFNELLTDSTSTVSNQASIHFNLAIIYERKKEFDTSIFHLKEILKIQDQWSEQLRLSQVYQMLSHCYELQLDSEQALNFLKMADSLKQIENFPEQLDIIETIKSDYEKKLLETEANFSKKEVEILSSKKRVLQIFLGITVVMIFIISLLLIIKNRQNKVLLKQNIEIAKRDYPEVKKSSELDETELELVKKFEIYLIDKKGFADQSITLDKVSKKLKTNRTYLSKAINVHYNCNFNEVLNRFRIQEARKLLIDKEYDHFSIEGVAKTIGYNTISTFNSSFKKETGLTPSYFRKNTINS